MTRRRLEPLQRREQLLDTAAAMFAAMPYEDVLVENIAARAGVSRALMYHHFPSKRDLFIAILRRASNRFLARVSPDPQLTLAEQLASGLEAHIQSFVDHPFEAFAINRGALSYDPAIQAIIAEELNVVGRRLVDQLVAEGHVHDATEIAVEGWLAFVRAASMKWVQSHGISRDELTEMCIRAFGCALGCPNTPHARPKELTSKRLRRGTFGSIAKLTTAFAASSGHRNRDASPFVWNATPDNIIARVQRSRDALRQSKSQTEH
jgi:AcrR family transcriptional regulator